MAKIFRLIQSYYVISLEQLFFDVNFKWMLAHRGGAGANHCPPVEGVV